MPTGLIMSTKKLSELRNLPVVNVTDGIEIGKVASFIIDFDKSKLTAFILASKNTGAGVKVVNLDSISSFGSFAMTITDVNQVEDLVNNSEYLKLFEKDIPLLGSSVYEEENKLLGFVKDTSININDGNIILLTLTSDSGFTSPYKATVPFSSIKSIEKDKIIISSGQRLSYRREGVAGRVEDSGSYVPLVLEEAKWKDAINERIKDEMLKVHNQLREQFLADHQQFYLAHERKRLTGEITDALISKFDQLISKNSVELSQELTKLLGEETKRLVSEDRLNSEVESFEKENLKSIEQLKGGINSSISEISDLVDSYKNELNESISGIKVFFNDEINKKTAELSEQFSSRIKDKIDVQKDLFAAEREKSDSEIDVKILELSANMKLLERGLRKNISDSISVIEKKHTDVNNNSVSLINSLDNNIENLKADYVLIKEKCEVLSSQLSKILDSTSNIKTIDDKCSNAIDTLNRDISLKISEMSSENESIISKQRDIDNRFSELSESMRQEIGAKVEELADDFEKRIAEVRSFETKLTESSRSNKEYIDGLISTLKDELKIIAGKSSGLDNRFSEFSESMRQEISGKIDHIDNKVLKNINEVLDSTNKDIEAIRNELRKTITDKESLDSKLELIEDVENKLEEINHEFGKIKESFDHEKEHVKSAFNTINDEYMKSSEIGDIERKLITNFSQKLQKQEELLLEKIDNVGNVAGDFVSRSEVDEQLDMMKQENEKLSEELRSDIEENYAIARDGFLNDKNDILKNISEVQERLGLQTEKISNDIINQVESLTADRLEKFVNSQQSAFIEKIMEIESRLENAGALSQHIDKLGSDVLKNEELNVETASIVRAVSDSLDQYAAKVEAIISDISGLRELSEGLEKSYESYTESEKSDEVDIDELVNDMNKRARKEFDLKASEIESFTRSMFEQVNNRVNKIQETMSRVLESDISKPIEEIKKEVTSEIESVKSIAENQIKESINDRFNESNEMLSSEIKKFADIQLNDDRIREIVSKITEEMRQTVLDEINSIITAKSESSIDGIVSKLSTEDMISEISRNIIGKIREEGLFKMIMDPAVMNKVSRSFPEEATENEFADAMGSGIAMEIIGNKVKRDIYTDDNHCIIKKGEVVTEETIRKAKEYGKFIELKLSVLK